MAAPSVSNNHSVDANAESPLKYPKEIEHWIPIHQCPDDEKEKEVERGEGRA